MEERELQPGQRVLTNRELGNTQGMMIAGRHLKARRANTEGVLKDFVPGHGGDVWWVDHGGDCVAVYSYTEFELI